MASTLRVNDQRVALVRNARVCRDGKTLGAAQPLSDFSNIAAWVLLGDPGSGKSDAFEHLAAVEGGYYTTAQDFLDLGVLSPLPSPLFIDAVDEVSTAHATGSTAISQIRRKLSELGTPRFRLSCREADWRGAADSAALQRLVGEGQFLELHLDPLDESQTTMLLAHWGQYDPASAQDFMRKARDQDLAELLVNPQTLRMLIQAAAQGWPTSKADAYAKACQGLLREFNIEHLAANRTRQVSDGQLLDATGYLCAVMLLSASSSLAWQHVDSHSGSTLVMPELPPAALAPDLATCRLATQTRLFKSDGRGKFVPVHRTVAEYCAAHYLVSRIHMGLPPNRVLALMLGHDGGVVPELRGLHAWLAACSQGNLRQDFIRRDPLGVVLSGDVRGFTRPEKLAVLNALRDEAVRDIHFRRSNWATRPFGALATQDMEADLGALLRSPDRSMAHLAEIDCVLDALAHGHTMPHLVAELEAVVRDNRFWIGSRKQAMGVLINYATQSGQWDGLQQILAGIHNNAIEDPEDELLGTVLQALYPNCIAPSAIWQYFRRPKSDTLMGAYWRFWYDLSRVKAPVADMPMLLDGLTAKGFRLDGAHDTLHAHAVIGHLLLRGISGFGASTEVQRLHAWLRLGLDSHFHCRLEAEHKQAIAQWLHAHPDPYKVLFEYGLQRNLGLGSSARIAVWETRSELYNAAMPEEADTWLLSLAARTTDDELRHELLGHASFFAQSNHGPDAALVLLEAWACAHPMDTPWVDTQLVCSYPPPASQQEFIDQETEYRQRIEEERRQKLAFFQQALPSFENGPAHLGALAQVASTYLNLFKESDKHDPEERLLESLNQNHEWVRLAMHGIQQSLFRSDLPSASDIVKLSVQGRRYNLAMPCLAAMAIRFSQNPLSAFDLSPAIVEAVIAFQLTNLFEDCPQWLGLLLQDQPDIAIGVMQELVSTQINAKKEHVDGMNALVNDPTFSNLAIGTLPTLIERFPAKAAKAQLQSCRSLIAGVLLHLDRATQIRLIEDRLSKNNMDVGQHVYWLTAGLLVSPSEYLAPVTAYLGMNQGRVNHLYQLLGEINRGEKLPTDQDALTICFLVELLGPLSRPYWMERSHQGSRITPSMDIGRHVENYISSLAGNPTAQAAVSLASLRENVQLKHWFDSLDRAISDQTVARRKALFSAMPASVVAQTLANLVPANAADLWALTVDHLQVLAREIRDGNTNDYRQYWANSKPKVEDDCRDALLSDLRRKVELLDIVAEPEGRYADAKRADIKVYAAGRHVPIEIKRESHRDLWSAIAEQLIAKYGREALTDGYGIYLVFWFSGNMAAAPGDGGRKPKTPKELQDRLVATVPHSLQHKIAVIVIDCSQPA